LCVQKLGYLIFTLHLVSLIFDKCKVMYLQVFVGLTPMKRADSKHCSFGRD